MSATALQVWRAATGPAAAVVVAAAFAAFSCFLFLVAFASESRAVWGLLLFAFAVFLSTLVHELGHALAAKMAGWRVIMIAVGPLAWHLPHREFVWTRRTEREDVGGWVTAVPSASCRNSRSRYALFVAGGPIASLAFAIACALAAVLILPDVSTPKVMWFMVGMGFALRSLSAFVVNIIPFGGGFDNDGGKLLRLYRASGEKILNPLTWIATLSFRKVRLREIPSWMVEEACVGSEDIQPVLVAYLDSLVVGRALDAEIVDVAHARAMIETYRATHGENDWLLACDAFHAAVHERDLDAGKSAVSKLNFPSQTEELSRAALAAISALAGCRNQMMAHLAVMDRIVQRRSRFTDFTYRDIRRKIEATLDNKSMFF